MGNTVYFANPEAAGDWQPLMGEVTKMVVFTPPSRQAMPHDELLAETLRRVNQLRMREGRDALYELPKGIPGTWGHCVLARAIGAAAGPLARQDPVLYEFVRRFDMLRVPELIDVRGYIEWRGVNVTPGDTVTLTSPNGAGPLTFTVPADEVAPVKTEAPTTRHESVSFSEHVFPSVKGASLLKHLMPF